MGILTAPASPYRLPPAATTEPHRPKQLAAAIIDTHPSVLNHPPEHLSRSLHELHHHFLDWPTGRKMREARYTPSQDAGVWLARCLWGGGADMLERLDYAAHLRK